MKQKTDQISMTRKNRPPNCVTVTRIGDTILTVRGYSDPKAKESVEDKLVRIIKKAATRECVNVPFADTG